jgi:hypothetical protein
MIAKMWDAFHADYPDIAGPVTRLLKKRDNDHRDRMNDAHTRLFEETMEVVYPDWQETLHSKAFLRWLDADPSRMERAHKPGVKAALKLLNEFDRAMGKPKRLPAGGDEGMAYSDELPQAKQPRGPDPFAGMASLADIIPTARGTVH